MRSRYTRLHGGDIPDCASCTHSSNCALTHDHKASSGNLMVSPRSAQLRCAIGFMTPLCFLQAEQNLQWPLPPEEEPVRAAAPQLLATEAAGEERGAPDPAPALAPPVPEERGAGTGPQLSPDGRMGRLGSGGAALGAWLERGGDGERIGVGAGLSLFWSPLVCSFLKSWVIRGISTVPLELVSMSQQVRVCALSQETQDCARVRWTLGRLIS